jgi:hypothetical protein
MMIEKTPTTIPAMTGLLRCCNECDVDPELTMAMAELGTSVVDGVADKVAVVEAEVEVEVEAAADDVGAVELVSPSVDGAAVSEVIGEVVGVS